MLSIMESSKITSATLFVFCMIISSCESFVEIEAPKTQLISDAIFTSETTATAALSNIYYQMSSGGYFTSGGLNGLTFLGALSADELELLSTDSNLEQIYNNSIIPSNSQVSSIWGGSYNLIYQANAVIEGLASSKLSENFKNQLTGEALFIRAFCHFYLVNLYGDVPYISSTDYRINTAVSRNSVDQVFQFILSDLNKAKSLLSEDYISGERIRPNKWAAEALLSRVYVYIEDWSKAEEGATLVINNSSFYNLVTLDEVFLKNSNEAIWQLKPVDPNLNTLEGNTFIITSTPTLTVLSGEFINAFELDDERQSKWVGAYVEGGDTWYFPFKYKIQIGGSPLDEYSMVLRLAEQYLIRAEAKAKQDKLGEAIADLDLIRSRAGLPLLSDINPAINKTDLLLKIEHERRMELFAEWGHRWLDLKRSDRVDLILAPVKSGWESTDVLYPIPQSDILVNQNLKPQNPGY